MKTRIIYIIGYIIGVAGVLLTSACVPERFEAPQDSETNRLVARMENQPNTKTALSDLIDGTYYPLWMEKDSLSVFTMSGQKPTAFTLISGAGETTALFEGPLYGDQYVALFPYSSQTQWVDNRLSFCLPESQQYQAGSFAPNGFPMIAVSETGELTFKNLCSIVHLSIKGSGVIGSITLHSDTHYLSGPASVDLAYGESPSLVMIEGGSHDVRLDCSAVLLNSEKEKDFYIVVPAATYDGFTLTVDAYTEKVTKSISHEVTLSRSELRSVTPFMVEAPSIDLDHIPDNQIWYKTRSGKALSPGDESDKPFDANIISNSYEGEYGIIILDAPLKAINRDAFFNKYNNEIMELHLPDCVEVIESNSLPCLDSFRVPGSLKRFYNTGNLSNRRIGKIYGPLVASDGRSVIRDGVLLAVLDGDWEEYVTPPEVKQMTEYCLGQTSIKKLVISEGVTMLAPIYIEGDGICSYAQNLETVYLPESLQQIRCGIGPAPNLKGFYGSSRCTTEDHLGLINPRDGGYLVEVVENVDLESYSVPEGVSFLWAEFKNWPNLKTIYLPGSIDQILRNRIINCPKFEGFSGPNVSEDGRCLVINGELAYFFGDGIKEYTLPSNVKTIMKFCFGPEIEKLVVNDGVGLLDYNCFEFATSLKTVVLPSTIRILSGSIFQGDTEIESMYLPVRTPPAVYSPPHSAHLPKLKIYVPEESLEDYKTNTSWMNGWSEYLEGYHFDSIDSPDPGTIDYSLDGKVTVLQEASSDVHGIDIVLLGDAFTDKQVKEGIYLQKMIEAMEVFFDVEPYRSFRQYFNVYTVNAISPSDFVWSDSTVFSSCIGSSNTITADTNTIMEYALKAIPDSQLDEATILMVVNTPYSFKYHRSGTCTTYTRDQTPKTDYGSGVGIALVTSTFEFSSLVGHEMGHAFAKLDDEYTSRATNDAPVPYSVIATKYADQERGWWKNVDFTSDPSQVKWARFLADKRYEKEGLGVYEGAGGYYKYGIYRPSLFGMMNDNTGGFNAPSREAIYYRIHKLAFGPDWEYDYEKFVEYDQGAKNIRPTSLERTGQAAKTYEVRDPLPVTNFNPDEWTITTMQ